jgi:hypothetical protein
MFSSPTEFNFHNPQRSHRAAGCGKSSADCADNADRLVFLSALSAQPADMWVGFNLVRPRTLRAKALRWDAKPAQSGLKPRSARFERASYISRVALARWLAWTAAAKV